MGNSPKNTKLDVKITINQHISLPDQLQMILRTIKGFDENLLAMKIFRVFAAFALADAAAMSGGMMANGLTYFLYISE